MSQGFTYEDSGVDYGALDEFKHAAQAAGRTTASAISWHGLNGVEESRGETAYLIELPDCYIAHTEEGLGTKNLVADEVRGQTNASYYYQEIGQDLAAAILNDLAASGAVPLSLAMHLAAGDSAWFKDRDRWRDLIVGFKMACVRAGCAWTCGETPVLKGIVAPGRVALSGSAVGIIKPKENWLCGSKIRSGDEIVLVGSSGVHANGLTIAKRIAELCGPAIYALPIAEGSNVTFGQALLFNPTVIYAPLIRSCQEAKVELHYAVPITGHGWRKLMRAEGRFHYLIVKLPEFQPIFRFIQQQCQMSTREMYATFNMGAGFALYVAKGVGDQVVEVARAFGMSALNAGIVSRASDGERRVILDPINEVFWEDELNLRG